MPEKTKRGTFIHGIAASEHLDSSGERIKIEGVDITSLTKDGTFNYEHDSKSPSSIVGKIWEAKKILKRSDCENEHQKEFWDKLKMPFIYVAGELFDAVGHQAASEVAAMLRYDQQEPLNKDAKKLINFSIEGSRVEKQGAIITKCIARKVSVTLTPCNKVCEAHELKIDDGAKKEAADGKFSFIQDVMSKADEPSCQIMKGEVPFMYKNEDVKIPAKQAVKEHKRLVNVLESPSHKDDKVEAKKQRKELKEYKEKLDKGEKKINPKDPVLNYDKVAPKALSEEKQKEYQTKVKAKLTKYDSNVRKAISASCGVGAAPATKVQGSAIAKNEGMVPKAPKQAGNLIGTTTSGKSVTSHGMIGNYQGFSSEDHAEAAEFHRQMIPKVKDLGLKDHHLNKMKLHTQAFSNMRNKEIVRGDKQKAMAQPAPQAPKTMHVPGPTNTPTGVMGYSATASQYGGLGPAPQQAAPAAPKLPGQAQIKSPAAMVTEKLKMAKSEFVLIRKLGEADINKASKNVREQRKKVFGTNSQPGAKTAMREKHIAHIKKFVDKFLGLDLQPSGGKVNDKTGERRNADNEIGVDKPDWRSGKFEAQWNPEAIVHEIAHLMLMPEGVSLEDGQRLMDKQYSDVQKQYGYMQQKRSQGEVQPMAAEQLIRRFLGMPASQVSVPVKDKNAPPRTSVEDPSQVIATRVRTPGKKEKYVDLIRQSKNLSPENRDRLHQIFSGNLKFHPDKGWQKSARSLDGAISNRQPGAVLARQDKKQSAELPPNVVRMKQPAPAPQAPVQPTAQPAMEQPKMKIAKSEFIYTNKKK